MKLPAIVILATILYLNLVKGETKSYIVTNDRLDNIESEEESLMIFDVQMVKRERFINGTVAVLEDFDDEQFEFMVEMFTSQNSDGNYQRMAFGIPKTRMCEGLQKFYAKFVQPSMVFGENTNFPYVDEEEGLCPLPKGKYWFREILLDTEPWPTQFPRGLLKLVVTMYKNDLVVGGAIAILKIEDRPT
uniref:Uncharacterized protein n=1 Tax=Glossina austeni TaxID=7395 RepID=A0A1A9UIX7_GLOAU